MCKYEVLYQGVYCKFNSCRFYTCLYGVAYHQACAPGLFFKPTIGSCTFPEEYDFCQVCF